MANLLFNQQARLHMTHIPYKGSGPTTMALLQKEIDVFFGTPAAVEPYIKSGDFKALAVTSKNRFASFPTVPTVAESGIAELQDFSVEIWWGLLAPSKTDPEVLDKIHAAAIKAVNDPKNRERWLTQGMVPTTTTRAEFQTMIRNDIKRWGQIVKDNQVKAD
jgi:tripartite-type tricarboxylate transporter receptor subunit TctC